MARRIRLLAVALAVTAGAPQALAQTAPVVPTEQALTTLISRPRPQSAAYRPVPKDALCPQWWGLARQAGWRGNQLETLDYIMHRESRCRPKAHNTTLNKDGSTDMGLTQINDRSWCLPSRYYKQGYLQSLGIIEYCEDLFDPLTNLKAAKALYDYSQENGSGFRPWGI